jgi:hypothetical protein
MRILLAATLCIAAMVLDARAPPMREAPLVRSGIDRRRGGRMGLRIWLD